MTISGSGPRMLPTERMTPRRQLEMIDVMAELGGTGRASLLGSTIASRMGMARKTVSRAAGFLTQAGLTQPLRSSWALTEVGLSLARLRGTDSARARLLLRDHWKDIWFQQVAVRFLTSGPLDEQEFAKHLSAGLPGRPERAVYLVEWMTYALLIERDELGQVSLPVAQRRPDGPPSAGPEPQSLLDPLFSAPVTQISALPDDQFIALMGAYRTVFSSLTPGNAKRSAS
ncbi:MULTISPECIES: hypothetical protein [Streptomyces]|uniref:MarR family transcriptional regulator n=1 Tax=Streptomyces demainii TaxID=588122 RepID=A0ABT9KHQ0_9ACTN|nr:MULTISPECIES: hypothetical protein [Streptomyces]MDP9607935.1 hypothetical protein [Streptomyces demainii]